MITLSTLNSATAQEVFDQVAKHLLIQNKKSEDAKPYPTCFYRGPNGLMCAAGCLISDSEYNEVFEEKPWGDLVLDHCITLKHSSLITRLQNIHDNIAVRKWKTSLANLAREENLSFSL